jgi:hypothetical protein
MSSLDGQEETYGYILGCCVSIVSNLIQCDKYPLSDLVLEADRLKKLAQVKSTLTNKTPGFAAVFTKLAFEVRIMSFDNLNALDVLTELVSDNKGFSIFEADSYVTIDGMKVQTLSHCVQICLNSEERRLREGMENLFAR